MPRASYSAKGPLEKAGAPPTRPEAQGRREMAWWLAARRPAWLSRLFKRTRKV